MCVCDRDRNREGLRQRRRDPETWLGQLMPIAELLAGLVSISLQLTFDAVASLE